MTRKQRILMKGRFDMGSVLIVHHNDADGRCAASIASDAITQMIETGVKDKTDIEFLEMDYGKKFPATGWLQGFEEMVIVDFSLKPEVWKAMRQVFRGRVVWIDHHKTCHTYEAEYGEKVPGIRDFTEPGKSGCELTYEFFYSLPAPWSVELIGIYDTWREQSEVFDESKDYIEGLKMCPWFGQPGSKGWIELIDTDFDPTDIIRNGSVASAFRRAYCDDLAKSFGYKTVFQIGDFCYVGYVLNVYKFGSLAFGKLMDDFPICCAYIHDGQKFTVSLYTNRDDIDVSDICRRYGGGGHRKAAGFVCEKLPFERKDNLYDPRSRC
jgi:uncharacterized protein